MNIKIIVWTALLTLFSAAANAFGGAWVETSQTDFADGFFNANVYTSAEGSSEGCVKSSPGAVYDLNKDSYPDIVISNMQGPNSYIYWGSATGFDSTNRTCLPTNGATGNSIDDINRDGHLDILFSNFDGAYSVIYWGSRNGFSAGDTTLLPSSGAHGNYICDLNHDGHHDIVISNWWGSESYIYWGGPGAKGGFSVARRTALPTSSAYDCAVADLNKDGRLDIVFGNGWDSNHQSFIYWGAGTDSIYYSASNRTALTAGHAEGVSIAKVNNDGWLDIVFSNNGDNYADDSYIYWGGSSGFSDINRTALPTLGARGNSVADFDHDGNNDIVFADWFDGSTHDIPSYIYWGPDFTVAARTALAGHGAVGPLVGKFLKGGPDVQILLTNGIQGPGFYGTTVNANTYLYGIDHNRTVTMLDSLPSVYAHLSTKDNGNVHDRSASESYCSSVGGDGAAIRTWGNCSWQATVPSGAVLEVAVRSGNTTTPDDGSWSGWSAVSSAGSPSNVPDAKYAQYRLLTSPNGAGETPLIDDVSIDFQPAGVAAGPQPTASQDRFACQRRGGQVMFEYELSRPGRVKVAVYNISGQRVAVPVDGYYGAGVHRLSWEWSHGRLASGTYAVRAAINDVCFTGKLLIVK